MSEITVEVIQRDETGKNANRRLRASGYVPAVVYGGGRESVPIQVEDKVIRVEGHTDNLKIHGALAQKYPTNWELSAARAVNVARYLQKQGIDPDILSATAFGEHKPVASNDTKEGRAKNRRIEIVLLPKEFR